MSPLLPGRRQERWRDIDRKPAGPLAWLRRLAALAALIYVALFAWTGQRVGRAQAAWEAGRADEAHGILSAAAFWRVRAGRVNDALGVVDLSRGRDDEARAHLAAARAGWFHPPAFGEEKVLLAFLRDGRYEPARLYADHRLALAGAPATALRLAMAENGLNRIDDAEKHLALAAADPSLGEAVAAQRALIAAKRKSGRADVLLDRSGAALEAVDLKTGRPGVLVPELAPLLAGPDGPALDARDLANRIHLTLDLEYQRAAEAALGAQQGSLVVIDVATGGLLAAASQPNGIPVAGGQAPPALVKRYEPGSIIKMITLAAALRQGTDLAPVFPLDCPGWVAIDGVAFRDWMPHKRVLSIDHAVAVSCNLAFGRIGQLVGRDALGAEMRRYGLDAGSGDPAPAWPGDFKYSAGALTPEDTAHPNYALARRAVGLDSIQITPIGAAVLAAGLARGGAPVAPHLVESKENILGETYWKHEAAPRDSDALGAAAAATMVQAMKAAVAGAGEAEGTARRAAQQGLSLAMKTGTSGKNPPGYDALVIGFAPADKPVIAWALVADHAGKAEFEGARITGEFLKRIRARLP